MKCKTCGGEMQPAAIKKNYSECCKCKHMRKTVKKFIEVCDEFKEIINYDEILRQREERLWKTSK